MEASAAAGDSLAARSDSLADFICKLSRTTPEEQAQDAQIGWREGVGKFFHRNHDPQLDDLIFFVAGSAGSTAAATLEAEETNDEMYSRALGGSEDQVYVKRRSKPDAAGVVDSSGIRSFPGDGARWRDTFCLNVLLQLRYTVTVAVGRMDSDKFSATEKVVAEAYPSISRPESVVAKGQTLYTYPLLCFTFDNFDELFQRIVVAKGQAIVFQLQVHGGSGAHLDLDRARALMLGTGDAEVGSLKPLRSTIFEGGVPYDRLKQGYQLRRPSIIDFRHFTNKKMAFLPMRGPGGKGRAEVGVLISDHQEPDPDEPEPAPDQGAGEGELAKAFSSSFRWISSVASEALGTKKVPENPALSCFLTTLTVHWHTIWMDLMQTLQ